MEITRTGTVRGTTRAAWRKWLTAHHAEESEAWLLLKVPSELGPRDVTYLDAVEEALCFGWIDGIAKRLDDRLAQRFTPRRPRSSWTELNKERARRLIAAGLMTEAGERVLPDLSTAGFRVAPDIRARLEQAGAWPRFAAFPALYQRVRVGYVEEQRKRDPAEFERRLASLVRRTAAGQMFGNWDDSGMPRSQ